MSREGESSGAGGGTAAGRRHGAPGKRRIDRAARPVLVCVGCGEVVAGPAVVYQSRVYCTWDCAAVAAGPVPGQFFG